jgi:NAD(P)H dehydrogenase (quinone)
MTADELGMEGSVAPYIHRYIQELIDSQYLFFIHPNWWGQPPAILKGYLDRVLRPPYTFDNPPGNGGGPPIGKLTGKYGIVFNTSNTGREREMKYFHDPLEHIWKYCVFSFCGITRYYRKNYAVVLNSTENERKLWLKEIETTVERIITE